MNEFLFLFLDAFVGNIPLVAIITNNTPKYIPEIVTKKTFSEFAPW